MGNTIELIVADNVNLNEIANLTTYSKEDLKAFNILDDENLLLSTLFCPTSSLQRKNLYSLSLLSSNKILFSSLELEKNKVLNNRFYKIKNIKIAC